MKATQAPLGAASAERSNPMSIANLFASQDSVNARAGRDEVRIVDLIVPAWRVVTYWCDRASKRQALAELDDRLLADAGFSREQVVAEARKPFWR
jgi:uncharacterized protein YjiS (DUF1127 family)